MKQISKLVPQLLELKKLGQSAANETNRARRNALALALFKTRSNRLVQFGALTVETWWSPSAQSYVTQTKDDGDQLGDCSYSGYKEAAAVEHARALINIAPL